MEDFYNIKKEYEQFFSAKTKEEQDKALDSLIRKMKLMTEDLNKTAKELEESHKKYGKAYAENLLIQKLCSAIVKQLMPGVTDEDIKYAINKFNNTYYLTQNKNKTVN